MEEDVIVDEILDVGDSTGDDLADTETGEGETGEVESDVPGTVSGGDSVGDSGSVLDNVMLMSIAEDVQLLADASTEGYLSSSIVAVFDRVVDKMDYKYYCAFRAGDSSDGYLYLSNNINGSTLNACNVVHMYRTYTDGVGYQYFYDVSYDDTETFNLGNGAMYYTNIVSGYPALGSPVETHISVWLPIFAVLTLVCGFMIRRKVKQC